MLLRGKNVFLEGLGEVWGPKENFSSSIHGLIAILTSSFSLSNIQQLQK
jgi:hypothetical protein